MKNVAIAVLLMLPLVVTPTVPAHSQDSSHHTHGSHMAAAQRLPTEPGQSAFAAIAEIVVILESDPETDWSKVDLNALRTHLVDMGELTLNTVVETVETDGKIVFVAAGSDRTRDAIQRMVPAHVGILSIETRWQVSTDLNDSGARLTIEATGPELDKIRGLGFFGVMATGAHHQEHHLAIARGEMVH